MKNIILFDDDNWVGLLPLTYTKPICELRIGILTVREKWEKYLDAKASFITQSFLSEKYPIKIEDDNIIINSTVLPNRKLVKLVEGLEKNQALVDDDELLAARIGKPQFEKLMRDQKMDELIGLNLAGDDEIPERMVKPYDIFRLNAVEMERDFQLLTAGRKSEPISKSNQVLNEENIFIEKGARVEMSMLNAKSGPIYIGKDAEVMEGCMIRGGFAMCEHSVLKMGTKSYGATTVGPYSKVGGEVNNIVVTGYSNKGHDGFLGNSVIGEWCNIGADTNSSNLKNNYAEVKLWSYESMRFAKTGLQFCGLIMGDHAKCGINTMFNTGTVVGVGANVFGSGFPRNFIPSFAWGGNSGFSTFRFGKAMETAKMVMARRDVDLEDEDKKILKHIYDISAQHRSWEKQVKAK